jgi:hypothetical protein
MLDKEKDRLKAVVARCPYFLQANQSLKLALGVPDRID